MSDEEQQEERTEEPTEKRRREFREEGQVAKSQEVNTAVLLSSALLVWFFYAPIFWQKFKVFLAGFWQIAGQFELSPDSVIHLLILTVKELAVIFWPLLLLAIVIGFLANYIQIGWLFTLKPLEPKLSKLDPIKGLGRMVSKRSLFEVAKSLGKLLIIGLIAYLTLASKFEQTLLLLDTSISQSIHFLGNVAGLILFKCCLALIILAILDFLYQRWEMEEKMKMTKKELKDEHKETEGDPQLKQKMKSIQKEMARKRMMAEVPDADVVITNPTHIAVALSYRREEMDAPQIVAKGNDQIALRIKEIAEDNDVPIVENPPLARTLNEVEIGESIPETMYKAVAEILAYVYNLKGKTL